MCPSMIGKAAAVMTADAPSPQMTATTVNTAKMIIVIIAAPIVRNVTPRFVWAVLLNVLIAANRYAADVRQYAANVKNNSVKIV